jgi:hypothetical protein
MYTLRKSFNRNDGFSIRALGRINARDHRLTVHKDSTRAALGFATADLCPGEA